ncbi:Transcription factor-like protein DPB, partial [Mucuna pruriens]
MGDDDEEEVVGCATTVSGQSASTNSLPPPADNTLLKLNHLDIHADDAGSHASVASVLSTNLFFFVSSTMLFHFLSLIFNFLKIKLILTSTGKKKKRGQRAVGPDKSGRGLRQFSMKVCEKVESRGRTTYNEVADELVAEFSDPSNSELSPDQQQYDEKNIRRRVYDALNVLMAMDIISKDKKEIQWKGLPRTSVNDIEELKSGVGNFAPSGLCFPCGGVLSYNSVNTERLGLRNSIEKKAAYLQELEEQFPFANYLYYYVKFIGLQNLIQRNEQLYSSGNPPSGGVSLPFILVQTRPHATVEVEISEDMQLVHFDFNSAPFELHDDNYVLKAMKFCERPQDDNTTHNLTDGGEGSSMSGLCQPQIPPTILNVSNRPPTSPPLPGILKARRNLLQLLDRHNSYSSVQPNHSVVCDARYSFGRRLTE